jgi:hypothetical protein
VGVADKLATCVADAVVDVLRVETGVLDAVRVAEVVEEKELLLDGVGVGDALLPVETVAVSDAVPDGDIDAVELVDGELPSDTLAVAVALASGGMEALDETELEVVAEALADGLRDGEATGDADCVRLLVAVTVALAVDELPVATVWEADTLALAVEVREGVGELEPLGDTVAATVLYADALLLPVVVTDTVAVDDAAAVRVPDAAVDGVAVPDAVMVAVPDAVMVAVPDAVMVAVPEEVMLGVAAAEARVAVADAEWVAVPEEVMLGVAAALRVPDADAVREADVVMVAVPDTVVEAVRLVVAVIDGVAVAVGVALGQHAPPPRLPSWFSCQVMVATPESYRS